MLDRKKSRALVRTEEGKYVPFEVEEKRGKRPKHLTTSINVRIPQEAKDILQDIADYEYIGGKVSELIRGWIREKIAGYQRNPRFKEFLERRKEWAEREGKLQGGKMKRRRYL